MSVAVEANDEDKLSDFVGGSLNILINIYKYN